MYNLYSLLTTLEHDVYWLNGFTRCLPSFYHQGVGSNPTTYIAF
jgi:hypothetical protein